MTFTCPLRVILVTLSCVSFKDYKTGGYHLEDCQADLGRFTTLLLLIAIAYSISTLRGGRICTKQVQHYIGRVAESKRSQNRHNNFWMGLYGSLWIDSFNLWSTFTTRLMVLKPQKHLFFQQGLNASSLIQFAL